METVHGTAQVGSFRIPGGSGIFLGVHLYLLDQFLLLFLYPTQESALLGRLFCPFSNKDAYGSSRISVVQHLLLQQRRKDVTQVKCLFLPCANGCSQVSLLTSQILLSYPYSGILSVHLALWLCECQVKFVESS